MKIGVIGNGFVGKATNILNCNDVDFIMYDINPELCYPIGTTLKDICKTEIIFISVPTPMNKDGSCYLGIVEKVVSNISEIVNLDEKLVVIRSTVPPGTSSKLNCYFMPEFLTEKNFEFDFRHCENWIFGLKNNSQDEHFKNKITELFNLSYYNNKIYYNTITFVSNDEAEMIKMFRNNFLALKVSFCCEIEEYCNLKSINYENVRKLAVLDKRIGPSHSKVPGPDGAKGFGGTCFPKDANSMLNLIEKESMKSYIIKSMITRNEEVDRSEQDWKENKGRSVI